MDAPRDTRPPSGNVLGSAAYLKTTYDLARAPKAGYPDRLARWLTDTVYGRTGSLLDVGCGRGDYLGAFKELGFTVAGVDISPAAPELAPGHEVRVVDLNDQPLPFPAGSFDFVFSKSVIEHTTTPTVLMAKMYEALKPGGTAVVMTPSWMHTYWGPFYIDHTHVTPFTAMSLQDALTLSGFTVERVEHFRQLPMVWGRPALGLAAAALSALRIPYRPMHRAPWPEDVNKVIRFAREAMLLAVAHKPAEEGG